jgi:hypothetical protein
MRTPTVSTAVCEELHHEDCAEVLGTANDITRVVALYKTVSASADSATRNSPVQCDVAAEIKQFLSTDAEGSEAEWAKLFSARCSSQGMEEAFQAVVDGMASSVKEAQLRIASHVVDRLLVQEESAMGALMLEGSRPETKEALDAHSRKTAASLARFQTIRRMVDHKVSRPEPSGVSRYMLESFKPVAEMLIDDLATCQPERVQEARGLIFSFWDALRLEGFNNHDIGLLMDSFREKLLPPTVDDPRLDRYMALLNAHSAVDMELTRARRIQYSLLVPHRVWSSAL